MNVFSPDDIRTSRFAAVPDADRLRLLNAQLAYAARRSPYYREALGGLGALNSLEALSDLPFLTSEVLRAQGRRLVCVPGSEVARIVSLSTSGSTGEAKRLYFTRGDLERTVAFFTEGMGWMTAPGDRVGVLMPCAAPDGIGDLLCRALRRLGAEPLAFGADRDLLAVGRSLREAEASVLVGFPRQIRLLALLCPDLRPRAVLLSADYVPAALPDRLRLRWGCAVTEHFGMTETGYGCAVEHPCAPGMVLRADELFAEIVEAGGGAPCRPGQPGELVLTTLRREAMPLIRYRTGDLAVMDAEGRLTRVLGRIGVARRFYRAEDALSALPWLYDYAIDGDGLRAFVSQEAPPDAGALLAAAAEDGRVLLRRISPEAAAKLPQGKRGHSAAGNS